MKGWRLVYLALAPFTFAAGVQSLLEWQRHSGQFDLYMGAALILLSPVWLLTWWKEREVAGPVEKPE